MTQQVFILILLLGQEEFKALRTNYMRECDGFILVFDITSKKTWKEALIFFELMKMTKEKDIFPLVLVGNKQDLSSEREVSKKDIENFKFMNWDIPYYETSARQDINIEEIFNDVCREILKVEIKKKELVLTPKKSKNFTSIIKKIFSPIRKNEDEKKRKLEKYDEEEKENFYFSPRKKIKL
jgi:GTPase SAR1 family protein